MEFQGPLCLFLFLFITLFSNSQANKFSIGWTPNPSENYNQWSGRNRFQVNDTIVFKYEKGSDSVLEVKKEDYDKCNKTNPINKFEEGNTEFKFDRPGPFYFISGKNGNCENGQKLIVVVISPRTTTSPAPVATSPSLSPAPSPPSPSPISTPPAGGPSPAPGSTSPSPTPSPAISTPPAGGPSPGSLAPESTTPSPSPIGSSPTGGPMAPGAPSGSALAPGSENSPDSSNATAPPPGSSGSFVTPSRFLVLLSVTVVGAAFMRY